MTNLSVNINKVALIRNARGGNIPDLIKFAQDCETYGAQGITVHPRPDQRHIRFDDIPALKEVVTTEFNIEGYPSADFLKLIKTYKPHQCTLVPDPPHVLTSNTGWDVKTNKKFLSEVIKQMHDWGVRVSLFLDPVEEYCERSKELASDRIELYTGPYAEHYTENPKEAILPYFNAALVCKNINLEINAGHDLSLNNLSDFISAIPETMEVSIGHALISDALYYGIKNTIQMYLLKISQGQNSTFIND
ncbi:MAG: pyridoxine 5'-phosphate synthase [Saprospiraceae bacterium]|nr:pyridoxine 5'-phosphate synthase [Saprospiraceae bacterium]